MGDKIVDKKSDKVVNNIYSILKKSPGLTITEIVEKIPFSRSAIRTALAKLEGAKKVSIRKVGMAKVYAWRDKK